MKVQIPASATTGTPCLQLIQKCADVGEHRPPCRCFLPAGHENTCLPAPQLEDHRTTKPKEHRMDPVFVIALSYQHFRNWADTLAEPRRKYIYVTSIQNLRGQKLTHANVIWLPGSYTRPDAPDLEEYCAMSRAIHDPKEPAA